MNTDFRIRVSLPGHPKALKLMRRCGDIAFYNLVKFWAYVAQNKPSGVLKGLDLEDIEIASGWNGQCYEYAQALLDLCFIDEIDGCYVVHDWEDHNGYACHAQERSEKAKKAAKARWNKQNDATSMDQALLNDATSNAPSPAPSPTPYSTQDYPFKFKKKVPLPKNFHTTTDMIEYAKELRYLGSPDEHTKTMILSASANGYKYKDWHSAWKTWLRNEIKKNPDLQEKEKVWADV